MKLVQIALRRETAIPVMTLAFASLVSVGLVFARILWTGNIRYSFLVWNLFLAWLPLLLSLLAWEESGQGTVRNWRFIGFAGAWLLFFPNSPYILTDLIHLNGRHFWVDLALFLLCAFTGLVLGFVSLFLMQSVVKRSAGPVAGWCFIGAAAGLGGFGVYLGRFLRFNSWDLLFRPLELLQGIGQWVSDPLSQPVNFAFPLLFAVFLFIAYLMLYALTQLRSMPAGGGDPSAP